MNQLEMQVNYCTYFFCLLFIRKHAPPNNDLIGSRFT